MTFTRRIVAAYKDDRLLSGGMRYLRRSLCELRFRLSLPITSGCNFPVIVTFGDFSSSEGQALKGSPRSGYRRLQQTTCNNSRD